MKYSTVCSGIEAPSVAWDALGWTPVWFSEIEKFPSSVLNYHYPHVPNLGDMTTIHNNEEFKSTRGAIDVFCGGTPCQSFSVAGLRKGMDDPRGNLALVFLAIVERIRPRWVVWENVPGVLSSNRGRDFGSFVGALGQLGYGWSYRILDAQYFGVPQRRRRVFVVGHIGSWQPSAAVLFELNSLRWNNPPSKESGQGFAREIANCLRANGPGTNRIGGSSGQDNIVAVAPCLTNTGKSAGSVTQQDAQNGALIVESRYARNGRGAPSPVCPPLKAQSGTNGKGDGAPLVFQSKASATNSMNPSIVSPSIDVGKSNGLDVFDFQQITSPQNRSNPMPGDPTGCLAKGSNLNLVDDNLIRRLTPIECERLQGFPDNYTRIAWRGKSHEFCPDSPRYRALGNSMAVPVMRWIGQRIEAVEAILKSQ